jgi:hypothetical protein
LALVWLLVGCLAWSGLTAATAHAGKDGAEWSVDDIVAADGNAIGDDDGAVAVCYNSGGQVIPCEKGGAWWDGSCYRFVASSDPQDPDPAVRQWWDFYGQTTGVLTGCVYDFVNGFPTWYMNSLTWSPAANQPPSLQEFADAAVLLLSGVVQAPQLGVWPGDLLENDPEAMGAVGMPAWFWSIDPGPGVAWAETRTTSVGGYTLRATVSLVNTVWQTGDGESELCALGKAPHNRHKVQPSPVCGHTYFQRGDYTITATTKVQIKWSSSSGRAGSVPLTVERSGVYHVGEIQVVVVTPP